MAKNPEPVALSTALESLRSELEAAWNAGHDRRIRFRVSEVTLTVAAVARAEGSGSAKVRWWLVEAGVSGTSGSESSQTLTLTLTPSLHEGGVDVPLDVFDREPEPEAGR
jgi:Trypsin-co-occurring domain 2